MSILGFSKKKANEHCEQTADKTKLQCEKYIFDKEGNKKVRTTATFAFGGDNKPEFEKYDGDPEDINSLANTAAKTMRILKKPQGDF